MAKKEEFFGHKCHKRLRLFHAVEILVEVTETEEQGWDFPDESILLKVPEGSQWNGIRRSLPSLLQKARRAIRTSVAESVIPCNLPGRDREAVYEAMLDAASGFDLREIDPASVPKGLNEKVVLSRELAKQVWSEVLHHLSTFVNCALENRYETSPELIARQTDSTFVDLFGAGGVFRLVKLCRDLYSDTEEVDETETEEEVDEMTVVAEGVLLGPVEQMVSPAAAVLMPEDGVPVTTLVTPNYVMVGPNPCGGEAIICSSGDPPDPVPPTPPVATPPGSNGRGNTGVPIPPGSNRGGNTGVPIPPGSGPAAPVDPEERHAAYFPTPSRTAVRASGKKVSERWQDWGVRAARLLIYVLFLFVCLWFVKAYQEKQAERDPRNRAAEEASFNSNYDQPSWEGQDERIFVPQG